MKLPFGIEEREGRWWLNGGEITAPIWDPESQENLYPPWWPFYFDKDRGKTFVLGRKP